MNQLKAQWALLQEKLDALSLRERGMAFAIAALALITLINIVVLDPLLEKQKKLSQQVLADQQQIAAMQVEIGAKVKSHEMDPDEAAKQRLKHLKFLSTKMRNELLDMKKGLISPDKMASLLEDLLKKNSTLRLTSLKTLPVTLLNEQAGMDGKGSGDKARQASSLLSDKEKNGNQSTGEAIYRHGVEIVVEGGYLDIMNYLAQLETMPWQLFWAKAHLKVNTYPDSTLTLTLFTLSLDKKWLNI